MADKTFSIHGASSSTVTLTIKRVTDNYYWTGTAFQSGAATVAMTETAIPGVTGISEYSSTTAPTARCFWWAVTSTGELLDRGEFFPYTRPAAAAEDLAPALADLKVYLNIASGNEERDDLLNFARNDAATRIEDYCKRQFATSSRTYYLNGLGTVELWIPDYPITAITSVYEDTEYPRSWDAADEIDSDYYIIANNSSSQNDESKNHILRIDGGVWSRGMQNYRVIATTGYTTIPADLYWAAVELAGHIFLRAENKTIGLTSRSEQGGSVGYDIDKSAWPPSVKNIVDRYVNWAL